MERIINIDIKGSYMRKTSNLAGVQGEANATTLHITFDDSWTDLAKTITFYNSKGENPVTILMTFEYQGVNSLEYNIPIPSEPLEYPGEMTFIIDGAENGRKQRSITDDLKVEPADIVTPAPFTPSETEQIVAALNALKSIVALQETLLQVKADLTGKAEQSTLLEVQSVIDSLGTADSAIKAVVDDIKLNGAKEATLNTVKTDTANIVSNGAKENTVVNSFRELTGELGSAFEGIASEISAVSTAVDGINTDGAKKTDLVPLTTGFTPELNLFDSIKDVYIRSGEASQLIGKTTDTNGGDKTGSLMGKANAIIAKLNQGGGGTATEETSLAIKAVVDSLAEALGNADDTGGTIGLTSLFAKINAILEKPSGGGGGGTGDALESTSQKILADTGAIKTAQGKQALEATLQAVKTLIGEVPPDSGIPTELASVLGILSALVEELQQSAIGKLPYLTNGFDNETTLFRAISIMVQYIEEMGDYLLGLDNGVGTTTDTGGTATTGTLMAKSNAIIEECRTQDNSLSAIYNRQSNQALESTLQAVVTKLDSFTDRAVTGL